MSHGIDTTDVPACPVCGTGGTIVLREVPDALYGVPGRWRYRRCPRCGLLWQDPMVTEASVGNIYKDYYTHVPPAAPVQSLTRRLYGSIRAGYLASEYGYPAAGFVERVAGHLLRLHPGRRADADFSAIYLPASARGRLLDVGCGRGETMKELAALGWAVQGIDTDPKAVEVARESGLQAFHGTIWSEHLQPTSFDVLWMSHVLEHVHRPIDVLGRCHELLRPGGTLVAVTPNSESWGCQVFGAAWRGLEPPRHLHIFSRRALVAAAASAGFAHAEVRVTLRNARAIHGMSQAISEAQREGRLVQTPAPTVRDEIWQGLEWLRTFRRPEDGEELVLVARAGNHGRPGSPTQGPA